MFLLSKRYSNLLLVTMIVGGLAACASTDTGSEAVIEDSSIESTVPAESEAGEEVAEAIEEPMEFEVTTPSISEVQPEVSAAPQEIADAEAATGALRGGLWNPLSIAGMSASSVGKPRASMTSRMYGRWACPRPSTFSM